MPFASLLLGVPFIYSIGDQLTLLMQLLLVLALCNNAKPAVD